MQSMFNTGGATVTNTFNTFCNSIERNAWFRVLLIVITALLLVSAYNKIQRCKTPRPFSGSFMEGFIQNSHSSSSGDVIVKQDANTKDAFYAAVYDQLFNQKVNNAYEVGTIINKYPDISNQTVALDVGARTGAYMNAFIQNGITNITGIESSADMIAQAKNAYPSLNLNIVQGDPTVASAFKPESFTLVSMLNFEVYYIPHTEQLFSNIYDWLKPGGYFVLHLVDPRKFNPSSMLGGENKTTNTPTPTKNGAQSVAKFNDFSYKSDVQIFPNDMVQYMEVFKDDKTGKVRKNVRNFKMPTPQTFIELATGVGFNMLGQIDLVKAQKEYQYFYLFYKPAN
jgi:SAM-dependent methyltransferase